MKAVTFVSLLVDVVINIDEGGVRGVSLILYLVYGMAAFIADTGSALSCCAVSNV